MRFLTILFVYLPILSTTHFAQSGPDYALSSSWAALPGQIPSGLQAKIKETDAKEKFDSLKKELIESCERQVLKKGQG